MDYRFQYIVRNHFLFLVLGNARLDVENTNLQACAENLFVPTEKEIGILIAGCEKKLSAYLQLLKTGMCSSEADQLKSTDIDFGRHVVRVTPEMNSSCHSEHNPRGETHGKI